MKKYGFLTDQTQLKNHDHIFTSVSLSSDGLLTSSMRLHFSKSSNLLVLIMIIHEAVFVAIVLGYIHVSFTIYFIICALSCLTNAQTDNFFLFSLSENGISFQLKADSSTATLISTVKY